jgi:hypothetical protein
VYFINPTQKWNWINIFSFRVNQKKTTFDNITVISYKNNFPQKILKKLFTKLNDYINYFKINKALSLKRNSLIWWKFDPYRFLSSCPFSNGKSIYHVVDPYHFLWQDEYHAKNTDLIVCTNPKYYEYYQKKYSQKTIIQIPHGISNEEFIIDEEEVKLIKEKFGKFIILVGTIANDVNLELLTEIEKKEVVLLVIGKEFIKNIQWEQLKKSKTIIYLGEIHAKKLKNYIAASKAGLVAYNFEENVSINNRTPLKIMNYLAQKKPIISSQKTSLSFLEDNSIYYATNSERYIEYIHRALEDKLTVDENKINLYLKEHEYQNLIAKILEQIE